MENSLRSLEDMISKQQYLLDSGAGTPESRAEAQETIQKAKARIESSQQAISNLRAAANQSRERIGELKRRNSEIEDLLSRN